MNLFKVYAEEDVFIFVYAEDGLEALNLANKEIPKLGFIKVEFIVTPTIITPSSF